MTVAIENDVASVRFDDFDLEAYELFLRAKKLPEKKISFDPADDSYTVETPARFAGILDPTIAAPSAVSSEDLAPHLFDYQRWIVERALDARRYAIWADTGLGKTAMFLEWGRQVGNDGAVLVFTPAMVLAQTIEEAQRFYKDLPFEPLRSRAELEKWLANPKGMAIASVGLMASAELHALRNLTGLVLDESSILKTGGGRIKWNLIHSTKGIPFKVSCTATPAPNDTMEYASQASFLEKLRSEGDILWTYFTRDKRGNWRVKPHARDAFYEFMSSWSIYMRDPAAYGFEDILAGLPDPEYFEHRIPITESQREAMSHLLVAKGRGLFDVSFGVQERSKFAQLARGFLYAGDETHPIESGKPEKVAEIAREEIGKKRPTLIWTNFDRESEILAELLPEAEELGGVTSEAKRQDLIEAFRHGDLECLITKPQVLGYGLNLQRCRAMIFSGLDDSFERRYQAVRRAYRLGQTEPVQVHLPHVPELEGLMLENVRAKEAQFEEDVAQAEARYVEAVQGG